ncbi:hypothetical protein ACJ41O_010383 [Fusarium nematophilum]
MAAFQDSEGLQVDHMKTPEVVAQANPAINHSAAASRQQRVPFGLKPWTFVIIVSSITALIVGAVGGALGAALANCQSSDSPGSPAETSACPSSDEANDTDSWNETMTAKDGTILYTPKPANQVQNLTLDCPEFGEVKERDIAGVEFVIRCGVDAPGGSRAEDSSTDTVSDIIGIVAYAIEGCLRACTQLRNGQTCKSAVFASPLQKYFDENGANCWLKDAKKARSPGVGLGETSSDRTLAYAERQFPEDD